jgi:hypothetical protein
LLQVRSAKVGWIVCGRDKYKRRLRIKTKHLSTALMIKSVLNDSKLSDFKAQVTVDSLLLTEK